LEVVVDKFKWGFIAILTAVLLLLPWLPFSSNKVLTLMIQMFLVASLAASWNILAGYAGQINLGHAAFFGLGALTTRLLWLNAYPFILSFLAGGAVATLFALIIGVPALRLKGIYFSIGTLALAEMLRVTVGNVLPGISALPAPDLINYDLAPRYYLISGLWVIIVGASFLISRSRIGLGIMTVREDEDAARAIGVNVFRHKLSAFVISAFFTGLTGSAFAYYHVSYYPQFTFNPVWTFDALIVTFIGGIGTIIGPIIGAVFFVLVRDVLTTSLTDFHLIIFGILIIAVVLLLPGGLVGLWHRAVRRKW
jgi:branched-chain amino acid transport system permease protein